MRGAANRVVSCSQSGLDYIFGVRVTQQHADSEQLAKSLLSLEIDGHSAIEETNVDC